MYSRLYSNTAVEQSHIKVFQVKTDNHVKEQGPILSIVKLFFQGVYILHIRTTKPNVTLYL